MIGRLKGKIDDLGDNWALIDVNGVGYRVFCSSRTLSHFVIGAVTVVEVETHVREDHIHLYGFADASERDWFKLLMTVQGVGAKVGLGILSVLEPDELMLAVAAADDGIVSRAPGVGPKLAKRIASELKDKVGAIAIDLNAKPRDREVISSTQHASLPNGVSEATSALVNLGYGSSEALVTVTRAAAKLGDGVGVEVLIREALRELAPVNLRKEG